jgi:predicted alpha/beta-hydrolase family hydrolase
MPDLTGSEIDLADAICELAARERAFVDALAALTAKQGPYVVLLASAGNPDFGEHPGRRKPGVPNKHVRVATLRAARDACRTYIEYYQLGGGNWVGGQVTSVASKAAVAQVSYNGRVWEPGSYPQPEIDVSGEATGAV